MFDTPAPARTLRSLFGALVFVIGAQSIRFFFGSLTWYLRDTVGVGVTDLIPIAIAPFLLGVALPIVCRVVTVRGALWVGIWILTLSRVVNQVSSDPSVELWSAAIGVAAFVGLLPLMFSMGRSTLVGGVLLGIALDSAIRGMGLSLDVSYQSGIAPLAMVVALSIAALYVLWASPPIERQGVGWRTGLVLTGIGPFLLFEFLVLQNQGWTSEVAGIGGAQAQLRIALLNVVALIVVTWLGRNRFLALIGLVVLVAAAIGAESSALSFNVLTLLAIPAAGLVWAAMVGDPEERGIGWQATFLTAGMVLFVVLGLLYYVPLDLDLGFTQQQVRHGAVLLLAGFGLAGVLMSPATRPGLSQQTWAFAALAASLPLLGFLFARSPSSAELALDDPLRVMTYNIHSSFNVDGRLDLDAIAEVIEDSGATIVGLQEVPRGRLISGVSDQLTLLIERTGFEYSAYFGTTDPTWGNAIISRFPIATAERAYLPLVGTPMRRGYVGASISVGGSRLLFITTHLQHVNDRSVHDDDPEADLYPVHQEQILEVLAQWGGREPAILVGDFNARPQWQQIADIADAGWVDSWTEAGVGDGYTASSDSPRFRIDYVFHTGDLVALDAGVIRSQASDHFPVVADLGRLP